MSILQESFSLRGDSEPSIVLANRIAKAALSERLALPDGTPSAELLRLYERWADSGAALLTTGNVMVDREHIAESGNVVVDDASDPALIRRWAATIQAGGCKAWMQINHPGRQAPRFVTAQPVAPSPVAMRGTGGTFAKPRELTHDEIVAIVARFARTAALAEQAGFDGVQIHGAHGYLVSQFLSPLTNLRNDAWGGDAERRRRFLFEVIAAVRAAVGSDFAVGLKLNSADFQRGGFTAEESMEVVAQIEGIDLLEVSGGTYEAAAMFEEHNKAASTRRREAFFLEYAERVRGYTQIPLMVTGGFRTARGMSDAIESGATDVIGLGRPFAVEPDFPRRLLDGSADAAMPIHLDTGIKKLDAIIQGGWYQLQLDRMGRGHDPDPKLSRARAVVGYAFPRQHLTRP